jgi:hypothetical protein
MARHADSPMDAPRTALSSGNPPAHASLLEEDRQVAALDPLHCDDFFSSSLPLLNERRDIDSLSLHARQFAERAVSLDHLSRADALAAVRDLGMLGASLTRQGVGPNAVPELPAALKYLSKTTDEVPRDTVFSYGPRNPAGPRLRRFTRLSEEAQLIESFRVGADAVGGAIAQLQPAHGMSPYEPAFATLVAAADESFQKMVQAITSIRKSISASTFVLYLRPFYFPYSVDGVTYFGPGGAQLPVVMLDMLTWADGERQPELHHFLRENLSYCPPHYRTLANAAEGSMSMLRRMEATPPDAGPAEVFKGSVRALGHFITQLLKFRYPHKRLSDENIRISEASDYQTAILLQLMHGTQEARARLRLLSRRLDRAV